MKALILKNTLTSLKEQDSPLERVELPIPTPGKREILIRVSVCGVCHTELDEIEGRTKPPHLPIILGHEVVGEVAKLGTQATHFEIGDRVGVGWIHQSSGGPKENLDNEFCATGRDRNGGYAEYCTVPEDYTYPIPKIFSDAEAAPLLCAGAIGYRALNLSHIKDHENLGLMGFGGCAHIILPLCKFLFPKTKIFVFARDAASRNFSKELGADWSGDISSPAPKPLHAVIDTTPAWKPVLAALKNLRPSGRLVINAIRKEDADKSVLGELTYEDHLWMEKEIKTVANITQHDIREFLPLAAKIPIRTTVETYAFEQANQALIDLKFKQVQGAKVLRIREA